MAVPVINISGKVRGPSGQLWGPGEIRLVLNHGGTAWVIDDVDGAIKYHLFGQQNLAIDATGEVAGTVIPNDLITPAGTSYKALYRIGGFVFEEDWTTVQSPTNQDIANISKTSSATTPTPLTLTPVATLPTADASRRGQVILLTGATGVEDATYLCLKTSGDTYDWVPWAFGG